jgi:Fe-S-cluster containining protein
LSSEGSVRRLPLVVEQGLASTRLAKTRLGDALAQRVGIENITCHRGCSHCCHYPMAISLFEGMSLYRALLRDGLWRQQLKASLEHHAGLTFGTAPEIWLMASIPCPLLAGGLCSVYSSRPFRCRATLSTKDPDLCRPAYFGRDTFEDVASETTEFDGHEQQASRASRDHARGLHERVPLSVAVLIGRQLVEEEIGFDEVALTLLRMLSRSS